MRNLRQVRVTFTTDCSQVVKMVSEPDVLPAFANYLEDIKTLRESFLTSEIIYVPRTQNLRADSLACSTMKQLSFIVYMDIVYMDAELPVWFTESV